MNTKLTKKQYLMISLMLFGMFFGAGNLIFPPMVGKMSGKNLIITMIFFCVTAVLLPILGVIAVAKSDGLKNLSARVDNKFAAVFTVLIYLAIGPLMGIPRAGSVPFEMAIKPYLPAGVPNQLAMLIYTLVFFGFSYWLSLTPGKLVDRMGKIITPILIALMVALFVVAVVRGVPSLGAPLADNYAKHPAVTGFVNGYMTLDTIAGLNFGLVVATVIREFNIDNESVIIKSTIKSGALSGIFLMVIYFMLSYIGAATAGMYPDTADGAEILGLVSMHFLGNAGAFLIAAIFTLACLTTCVGLITSSSNYFHTLNNKVSYKTWVTIWTVWSLLFANVGLGAILKYSKGILLAIYPVSIVLILLSLGEKWIQSNRLVYSTTVYLTAVIGIVNAADNLGFKIPVLFDLCKGLPLYAEQLGWVIPAGICFIISFLVSKINFNMSKELSH